MFVTEGPVDPESRLFVGRTEELSQMEAWLISVRCVGAVLGARQTGKTSLLLKLRHILRRKYAFVFIDLEAVAGAEFGECLSYVALEMSTQLFEDNQVAKPKLPTKQHEFLAFLESCARAAAGVRIVVLLDEIGALLPAASLRLTSAIRAVFTVRHVKPEFARIVFVVAGATDMLDLATGLNSPLKNVAETLYLGDLSVVETRRLVTEMFDDTSSPSSNCFQVLHDWTGGHPYWTQRLGEALQRQPDAASGASVASAVEHLLNTEDRNLPYVFRALDADRTLRDVMTAIAGGASISFTRANGAIAKLELLGVLKNHGGRCAIRNRIYREALLREPVRPLRIPWRSLRHLTEHFLKADDEDTLIQTATLDLQETMRNRSVVYLTRQPRDGWFTVVSSAGISDSALARLGRDSRYQLSLSLTKPTELSAADLPADETERLNGLGTSLVIPVRSKDVTLGFFCLGRKLSGDEYDVDDLEFMTTVGEQTGAAIERVRLQALERDAQKAWVIQSSFLPRTLPQVEGLGMAASCQPARVVGGDYYDAFALTDRILAFCVADVVGKGIPAAIRMASLHTAVRALSPESLNTGLLSSAVNRLVAQSVQPGEFITFFYALFDTITRELMYTNAGHNPPILRRGPEQVVRLIEGGPPLGIFPEYGYAHDRLTLLTGDRLILFTDGVTESRNRDGEEFGDDRLIALAREGSDAQRLHGGVIDAVTKFCGALFHDDVTLLVITC